MDLLFVRLVAIHVSGRVDEPCNVQAHRVPKCRREECILKSFSPKIHRYQCRNYEAHYWHYDKEISETNEGNTIKDDK